MRFKRLVQKIGIKVARTFGNPDVLGAEKTDYATEVFSICKRLISKEDTILLISPISGKRYIKSDDSQLFIIVQTSQVTLVNHAYSYDIDVTGKAHERIARIFDNEVERRRELMEREIKSNVQKSLRTIYENLNDE